MDIVLIAARITLAGSWGIAAIGKMLEWETVPPVLARSNLPPWMVRAIVLGLPPLELLLAVLLLSGFAWFGALASGLLLAGFAVVLAMTVSQRTSGGCGCLGRFERSTLPVAGLVRAELLAALAAAIVALGWSRSFPSLLPWLTPMHVWQWLVVAGVVAAVGFRKPLATGWGRLVDYAAGRAQPTMTPLAGLPVGAAAPISYRPQEREALVFVRERCAPCEELFSALPRGAAIPSLRIVSVNGDRTAAQTYRVPGVPAAVLIDADGTIASPLAVGAAAVRTLLERG